jgi:hypothetical protein
MSLRPRNNGKMKWVLEVGTGVLAYIKNWGRRRRRRRRRRRGRRKERVLSECYIEFLVLYFCVVYTIPQMVTN